MVRELTKVRGSRLRAVAVAGMAGTLLLGCGPGAGPRPSAQAKTPVRPHFKVLVFSRTVGFRHASIPAGIELVNRLGAAGGFDVTATEDGSIFTDANLTGFRVVVFLMTTGNVLDAAHQAAFQRYLGGGGGYVGVHSAADTAYDWDWYGRLVGAYFKQHPAVQTATVRVDDSRHPSTSRVPSPWVRTDEWYDFSSNPRSRVHVLLSLEEASYSGGTMGPDHPIAWCHLFEGGRAWYTGMGHTVESYVEDQPFATHLGGGIAWAAGGPGSC